MRIFSFFFLFFFRPLSCGPDFNFRDTSINPEKSIFTPVQLKSECLYEDLLYLLIHKKYFSLA